MDFKQKTYRHHLFFTVNYCVIKTTKDNINTTIYTNNNINYLHPVQVHDEEVTCYTLQSGQYNVIMTPI